MFIFNYIHSILPGGTPPACLVRLRKLRIILIFCCNYLLSAACSSFLQVQQQSRLPNPNTSCSLQSSLCSLLAPSLSLSRRKGFNFISMPLPQVRVSVCLCLPAAGTHTHSSEGRGYLRGRGRDWDRVACCRCLRYLRNSIRKATMRRKQMEAMARVAS